MRHPIALPTADIGGAGPPARLPEIRE